MVSPDGRGVLSVHPGRGCDKAHATGRGGSVRQGSAQGEEDQAVTARSYGEASLWCVHRRSVSAETARET